MKKYLYIILPAILFAFNGCKKDAANNPVAIVPSITIQSVSYPKFANSNWQQILGGNVAIEFDLLNSIDSVSTRIKDSTAVENISTYNKILNAGTYNVYISSKSTAVADTFLRFSAQIKQLSLSNKQALSLTATSTDGLITIGQSFVQSGTVPSFKPDSSTATYKFGISNGFYYLYVKGGKSGTITFTSKAGGQTITKSLSVVALNQYNLALQTNNGSLQVVFVPFVYNQVAVSSSTLMTLNITPGAYIYTASSSTYFVVTDENGAILNEIKYVKGTSTLKIASLQPFEKTRFNFFEIDVYADPNVAPDVIGFLQVKKGSTFTRNQPFPPQKQVYPITPHLKNSTGFDQLNISTDIEGLYIGAPADSASLNGLNYSAGTKLWVQMLKNNQYSYNFFTIPNGTTNFNVDLSQLNETPLVQTIKSPGNNLQVNVSARADTNYSDAYNFGITRTQSNQLDYYYPSETFEQYDVLTYYSIGNLNYTIATAGKTIPAQAAVFGASFNIQASTLANFVPSFSGTFDYYHASFANYTPGSNLQIDLYSPSAANYTNIKLPDFSKYLGITSLDLNSLSLKFFGLYQAEGFNESNFFYRDYHIYPNINGKGVEESY